MDNGPIKAKVADFEGEIVGVDSDGIHWETEMVPGKLVPLVASCSAGALLDVIGPEGAFKALARKWWIRPEAGGLKVRLLLERQVAG